MRWKTHPLFQLLFILFDSNDYLLFSTIISAIKRVIKSTDFLHLAESSVNPSRSRTFSPARSLCPVQNLPFYVLCFRYICSDIAGTHPYCRISYFDLWFLFCRIYILQDRSRYYPNYSQSSWLWITLKLPHAPLCSHNTPAISPRAGTSLSPRLWRSFGRYHPFLMYLKLNVLSRLSYFSATFSTVPFITLRQQRGLSPTDLLDVWHANTSSYTCSLFLLYHFMPPIVVFSDPLAIKKIGKRYSRKNLGFTEVFTVRRSFFWCAVS